VGKVVDLQVEPVEDHFQVIKLTHIKAKNVEYTIALQS